MKRDFLAVGFVFLTTIVPEKSIADVIKLECEYPTFADEEGIHQQNFSLTFMVDSITYEAFMVGNNGMSAVQVVDNLGGGLTFIEKTESGNVNVTIVMLSSMKSVHSRQPIIIDEIMPSQNYGSCRVGM